MQTLTNVASQFDIPVVYRWEIDDNIDLITQVRELEGSEGVVIEYDDGTRVKAKSLWYVDLHKNREAIARERYVVSLILNERVDDVYSLVPDFVRPRLEGYTKNFLHEYERLADRITIRLHELLKEKPSRKEFALTEGIDHTIRWIGFKIFDENIDRVGVNVRTWLKDIVLRATNSDTDFNEKIRGDLLKGVLPEWNIWDGTPDIDE